MRTRAARIQLFANTLGWLLLAVASGAHADDPDYPITLPDADSGEPATDRDDSGPPPLRFELQLLGVLTFPNHASQSSAGFGFALCYGVGWGDIPLTLGVDFMSIDGITRAKTDVRLNVEGDTFNATKTARERVLHFDLWARIQPPHWSVRPYVEGFMGTKVLQTNYSFEFAIDNSENDYAKDHDWTSSLGWGVGVDFPGLLSRDGQISLMLGFRRLSGSKARLERTAQIDGQTVIAGHSVPTDVTIVMLGVGGSAEL
jgi:hypothetical protein